MPKRKTSMRDEDAFDGGSSDSSFYEPTAAAPASKPRRRTAKKPKRPVEEDAEDDIAVYPPNPHALSRHTVQSPALQQKALLVWFEGVHDSRGMPWRKAYDASLTEDERTQRAYEVWVSEIMLQQTQVTTVIPYWTRWMKSFPTIKNLAESDIETVNGLWKGLGYYSRAARLFAGAKKVVEELGGRLPNNAKDMQSLMPGIGRYTAGAICSIAYNEQAPVLDGNVTRLLSRVLALHAQPKSKASLDVLWSGAEAMVTGCTRAGELNQALIELGSTICKPRDPLCNSCPISAWCQAYQTSQAKPEVSLPDIEDACTLCEPIPKIDSSSLPPVTSYPMKVERKKQREELDIVSVIEWEGAEDRWFLLLRRPEEGLLAGLHEFPTVDNVDKSITPADVKKIPAKLLPGLLRVFADEAFGSDSSSDKPRVAKVKYVGDVLHIFSHIRKTYRVQWVVLQGGSDSPPTLLPRPPLPTSRALTAKTTKGKNGKKDTSEATGTGALSTTSKWVRLDDVEHANVGTGVMKVWKLVRALWDE